MKYRRVTSVGLVLLCYLVGCSEEGASSSSPTTGDAGSTARERIPSPDLSGMQPQVASAITEARQRVVDRPGSATAWGQFGMIVDAHGLRTEALDAYTEARRLAPEEFRWSYLLATTMEFFNAPASEILAEYEEAAKLLPSYPPVYVHKGEVLARLSEPARAREAYLQAISLDPNLAYAHRGAGQTALLMDDADAAITHLRRANELVPNDRSVIASLAQAIRRKGLKEEANRLAERSLEMSEVLALPDPVRYEVTQLKLTAAACRDRALILARQGNGDAALRALAPLEQVDPPDEFFHLTAGNAYAQIANWELASKHFNRCIDINPNMASAYVEIANVYMAQRQLKPAEEALSRAIEIEPENAVALATMGTIFAAHGREAEAIDAFERAARHGSLGARHEAMWATALLRRGDAEAASERYEAVLKRVPNDVTARFNYAMSLEQIGRIADAAAQYEMVLAGDPTHEMARQRLARVRRGG